MGDFPNLDNVNVYRYDNTLDYSRFKPTARLKMCNVPWCGDYDNVVKFDDDAARDAWFDALEGEVVNLDTMFNVKPDGASKVPVPVTSAQGYNYLVVDLPRMTSDARPLAYAAGERKRRYCYFIQDAQQLSPNSTRLILTLDVWTTYINEMRFDYVLLERGHAPVAASSVADYLANPRDNSAYLLSDDVNTGGEPYVETARAVKNYSAETQRACIATYADLQGDIGTASAPKVPAISESATAGMLAPRVYSVAVGDLQPFLRALDANAPWMKSAVLGVFFAPSDLLTQSAPFALWGVSITVLDAVQKIETFMRPGVADFAYPAQAAGFAKLYTYPYAAIRIGDERGQTSTVRIEDLGANGIQLASAVNLVMPYISIDARLLGIAGATDSLTFQTIEGRTYSYGGAWGKYLKSWNLPVMQVSQSAASRAAYTTVYNRAHARLAADNALASSLASNSTAYTNVNNSAKNVTDNNAVNTEANTAVTKNSNDWALTGAAASNKKLKNDCDADNETSTEMKGVKNEVVSITTANNNAAAISTTFGSVVTGGLTGGSEDAKSAAIGGVADLAVAIPMANAAAAISQTSNSLASTLAQTNAIKKTANAAEFTAETWRIQNNASTIATTLRNEASTKVANNNAAVMRTNAGNTKSTGDANANRTHATAIDAIAAGLNQASVAAPAQFGANANGQSGTTAPRALFAQIVTQRECDIMNAASAFARYGYTLMREFSMERMQVMRHFTYWKCAEVWCSGNGNALEGAQGAIKDILIRGVTVWSKPEEIGRVSIYDNL